MRPLEMHDGDFFENVTVSKSTNICECPPYIRDGYEFSLGGVFTVEYCKCCGFFYLSEKDGEHWFALSCDLNKSLKILHRNILDSLKTIRPHLRKG